MENCAVSCILVGEETEAQRDYVTSPEPHRYLVTESEETSFVLRVRVFSIGYLFSDH